MSWEFRPPDDRDTLVIFGILLVPAIVGVFLLIFFR